MVKGNQTKKLKLHTMGLLLSGYGSVFSLMFANVSAMRSAGLRGTHYQTTQAYERGRTLEFSNKPALRMSGY